MQRPEHSHALAGATCGSGSRYGIQVVGRFHVSPFILNQSVATSLDRRSKNRLQHVPLMFLLELKPDTRPFLIQLAMLRNRACRLHAAYAWAFEGLADSLFSLSKFRHTGLLGFWVRGDFSNSVQVPDFITSLPSTERDRISWKAFYMFP